MSKKKKPDPPDPEDNASKPKREKSKPTIFPKRTDKETEVPAFRVDPSRFGREIKISEE
jgi:hypothetical protein